MCPYRAFLPNNYILQSSVFNQASGTESVKERLDSNEREERRAAFVPGILNPALVVTAKTRRSIRKESDPAKNIMVSAGAQTKK